MKHNMRLVVLCQLVTHFYKYVLKINCNDLKIWKNIYVKVVGKQENNLLPRQNLIKRNNLIRSFVR